MAKSRRTDHWADLLAITGQFYWPPAGTITDRGWAEIPAIDSLNQRSSHRRAAAAIPSEPSKRQGDLCHTGHARVVETLRHSENIHNNNVRVGVLIIGKDISRC